jgi:hypothetical protein
MTKPRVAECSLDLRGGTMDGDCGSTGDLDCTFRINVPLEKMMQDGVYWGDAQGSLKNSRRWFDPPPPN